MRFAVGRIDRRLFLQRPDSRAIAFEGLLNSGDNFAARLKAGIQRWIAAAAGARGHRWRVLWSPSQVRRNGAGLCVAASRTGQDSQADQLRQISSSSFRRSTSARSWTNTSWSCAHGVERWRSNCGCNGGKPGWNQAWRAPLRKALDELRDAIAPLTEQEGDKLFKDVWAARDAYIQVVLDRSDESTERFFTEHQSHALTEAERVRALELMEMQRHAQLMYTSCGWFFDDISGIETVQVIAYAARVLQLAQRGIRRASRGLEPAVSRATRRSAARTWPSAGDGARIYNEKRRAMELGLEQVAAHYAISSVFSSFAEETDLFCYRVRRISYDIYTSGRGRLALGRAHVASAITGDAAELLVSRCCILAIRTLPPP